MSNVYEVIYVTYEGALVKTKYFSSLLKVDREVDEFLSYLEFPAIQGSSEKDIFLGNKMLIREYEISEINTEIMHYKVKVYKLIID